MTVIEAVRTRLLQIDALTALVGTRIYALKLPQSPTLPAMRLQQIGREELTHLRGSTGIYRARVQVDAVTEEASGGDPYEEAHAVSDAAHGDGFDCENASGLNGWRGDIGSPAFTITGVLPVPSGGPREMVDPDELNQVKVMHDYFVWFTR
jgi:hypothetical protein